MGGNLNIRVIYHVIKSSKLLLIWPPSKISRTKKALLTQLIFAGGQTNDNFMKLNTSSSARHKTNANYGNLVYDEVDKRVTNNLLCDSCLTLELG